MKSSTPAFSGRSIRGSRADSWFRRMYRYSLLLGIDPKATLNTAVGMRRVRSDRAEYLRQLTTSSSTGLFEMGRPYPIVGEWAEQAGAAQGHYFHQDLLVAREIFSRNPKRHIDVGSSIYGFVSHVATYREIEVLDIRSVDAHVAGIKFLQADVMKSDSSMRHITDSLSCLHALEHFGLGRYGDAIDVDGWRKGLTNLTNMVKPGGIFYLSVPTGMTQRVEFNAHRVFSIPFLRDVLAEEFRTERLAFVDDSGSLLPDVDPYSPEAERSLNANYGCSIWILRKR